MWARTNNTANVNGLGLVKKNQPRTSGTGSVKSFRNYHSEGRKNTGVARQDVSFEGRNYENWKKEKNRHCQNDDESGKIGKIQRALKESQNTVQKEGTNASLSHRNHNSHNHRKSSRTIDEVLRDCKTILQKDELKSKQTLFKNSYPQQSKKQSYEKHSLLESQKTGATNHSVRKCISENKMRKYDYLGDRDRLIGQKCYEWSNNGIVIKPSYQKQNKYEEVVRNDYEGRRKENSITKKFQDFQSREKKYDIPVSLGGYRKHEEKPCLIKRQLKINQKLEKPETFESYSPIKRITSNSSNQLRQIMKSPISHQKPQPTPATLKYHQNPESQCLKNYKVNLLNCELGRKNKNERSFQWRDDEDISEQRIDRIHQRIESYFQGSITFR